MNSLLENMAKVQVENFSRWHEKMLRPEGRHIRQVDHSRRIVRDHKGKNGVLHQVIE